jgi:phenylpyruvate tautomerase PptA (4-oxalocrotonate tautomerase family)
MDTINEKMELPRSADGLTRRNVLMTATIASGALASAPRALADAAPAGSFGAPVVQLYLAAGVSTLEQRSAMIKGITDVVLSATKQGIDPAKRLFVQIFETAEGGFGINGQVFVPRK